jgi:hypothetical protein
MIGNDNKRSFMSFNSNDFKGFTFRSGAVKKTTEQNSTFWDTNSNDVDVDEFLGIDTTTKKGKDLVALAGYKRAISNFVNIVTEQSIPVVFNSNDQSYTDGKKVVIGSNIDDKKFDVAVGLALHEGSHIKLSDFTLLKNLETSIPQEIYVLAESVGVKRYDVISTVKSILNYVEDRRIDSFIFQTSPGYKSYYHSMYEKYFYSKNVDKGLLSSEFRTEEIDSYMFRIINLHNKNRQLGSLKGLKEISSLINLGNIQRGGLKTTDDCFKIACDVMSVILKSIDPIVVKDDSQDGDSDEENDDSEEGNGSGGSNTLTDEELQEAIDSDSIGSSTPDENLSNDDGSDSIELSPRQKQMLEKHFEKQEKFLDGDVQKTKLNKKESSDIKSIEESGATYENVGNGIPNDSWSGSISKGTKCLVVRKLTQAVIDSNQFGCASSYNQGSYSRYGKYNFVEEGLRLGSMLGRKLQVRGEESQLKFSRQDSGKIDKRLIAELGFGNSNVFSHTLTERYNKAYLHISVDASGSMTGDKWNKAMTSCVAMIKACDMAGNIDVVVTTRTSNWTRGSGQGVPMIMVCYDSRVDKLQKVKNLFTALDVSGTTPEGLCFEAIEKDLIPGNSNQDSYFINFSDGQPYYSNDEINYSGDKAEAHTKKMCDNMRAKGISVLSYFISNYDLDDDSYDVKAFKKMYGKDAEFVNTTNMMAVAKTMNKKFLEV